MASKVWIAVGEGYEIAFDQRARGQESAYWVGRIRKDGADVGSFSNDGNGGCSIIRSLAVRAAFDAMVVKASGGKLAFEPAETLIAFAEENLVRQRRKIAPLTLEAYCAIQVRQHEAYYRKHKMPVPETF